MIAGLAANIQNRENERGSCSTPPSNLSRRSCHCRHGGGSARNGLANQFVVESVYCPPGYYALVLERNKRSERAEDGLCRFNRDIYRGVRCGCDQQDNTAVSTQSFLTMDASEGSQCHYFSMYTGDWVCYMLSSHGLAYSCCCRSSAVMAIGTPHLVVNDPSLIN